jgi:heme-binding NEAT domain protein
MEKYRIVEVKIPKLNEQHSGAVDWVPDIEYEYEYHIERYIDNGLWGWGNDWVPGYHPNTFSSLKQAERQIEFMNESRSSKVVKEY